MADLVVDTGLLRASAAELASVAATADRIGNGHARLGEVVWASGSYRAANGLDSFLSSWTYGVRCIASQAGEVGNQLIRSAVAYESVEVVLAAAAVGHAVSTPIATLSPSVQSRYEEPLRPARRLTTAIGQPVQLATATHVTQLIPGDPEQVALAARLLLRFADELADARLALARVSLGSWVGAAARVMTSELEQVAGRLRTAESAFYEAGTAVGAYARAHRDAQADAARALEMWQSAELASRAAHGAVIGAAPTGGPADPDAVLARAAALLADAQDRFAMAGRALAEILEQAEQGSPNSPGLFARIGRGITSLVTGVVEGVWGMGEGALVMAGLAVQLNPARAIYDPDGYQSSSDALWAGLEYAGTHPLQVGAALIDYDTWREDPARALGRLVPDLIAIGLTAGAAGATRGAAASDRLSSAATIIDEANATGRGLFRPVDDAIAARRLDELGLDHTSAAGTASRVQLDPPFGGVDHWVPVRLAEGDRLLVDAEGFAAPLGSRLPTDAQVWFEDLQIPPRRDRLPDGSVGPPGYAPDVFVFEVGPGGVDTATATALANAQFGAGGGTQLAVADLRAAIADGRLIPRGTHEFDPDTLTARIEDPRFREVDPGLPDRPLDPAREELLGRTRGATQEAAESARDVTLTTGAAGALDQIEQGAPR